MGRFAVLRFFCCLSTATAANVGHDAGAHTFVLRITSAETARRATLEQWCLRELANQTEQRQELAKLRDEVSGLAGDATLLKSLAQKVDGMVSMLQKEHAQAISEVSRSKEKLDAATLQIDVFRRVVARISSVPGQSPDALRVLSHQLQEAQAQRDKFEQEVRQRASSATRFESQLGADVSASSRDVVQLGARRLAARASQKLALSALEEDDAYLVHVHGICNMAKEIHVRFDAQVRPVLDRVVDALAQLATTPTTQMVDPFANDFGDDVLQVSTIATVPSHSLRGARHTPQQQAQAAQIQMQQPPQQQQEDLQQQMQQPPQQAPQKPRADESSSAAAMTPVRTVTTSQPPLPVTTISVPAVTTTAPAKTAVSPTHLSAAALPPPPPSRATSFAAVPSAPTEPEAPEEPPKTTEPERHAKVQPAVVATQDGAEAAAAAAAVTESGAGQVGASNASPFPDLKGGWRSMLSKQKQKKHKFHDEAQEVMDLVQTPSSYTAWHPDHADLSSATPSKSALLAAERAFDDDSDEDAGAAKDGADVAGSADKESAAPSFLQVAQGARLKSTTAASKAVVVDNSSVASLVLEQFAISLKSTRLLQLARAHLGVAQFRHLGQGTGDVGGGSPAFKDDAEPKVLEWCREYAARSSQGVAMLEGVGAPQHAALQLLGFQARRAVLQGAFTAWKGLADLFHADAQGVAALLSNTSQQAESAAAGFQSLSTALRAALAARRDSQDLGDLPETLGRAAGLAASGDSMLLNAIKAAADHRAEAEHSSRDSASQLQASLAQLGDASGNSAEDSPLPGVAFAEATPPDLPEHYQQLCAWALQGDEARRRRERGERDALRAAIALAGVA